MKMNETMHAIASNRLVPLPRGRHQWACRCSCSTARHRRMCVAYNENKLSAVPTPPKTQDRTTTPRSDRIVEV